MYKALLLLALAVAVLLGSGCRREGQEPPSSGAQISMTAIPFPAAIGPSRLVIQIKDGNGEPITDAALAVKGDMTHAGMVPVLAEIEGADEDGVYNVPFEWTMAGDWVVTVEARLSDGSRLKQRFDVAVFEPAPA